MKLPNSHSLEDNTSVVIVWLYSYNGRGVYHSVEKDDASAGIAHVGDQFLEKITFATLTIPAALIPGTLQVIFEDNLGKHLGLYCARSSKQTDFFKGINKFNLIF